MAFLMDMIKDELAGMARAAYDAQKDGQIDWMEGIMLGNRALGAATSIMGAFKQLQDGEFKDFLDVFEESDLVVAPKSNNPFA